MYSFATKAIHIGQEPDQISGAVIPPISLSTTFQQNSPGVHKGWDYSRSGNPTRDSLEKTISSLEQGKYGLAFASGLAATTSILHLFSSNDEVIVADDVYGGTNRLFSRIIKPHANIKFNFVDLNNINSLLTQINSNTKLIWLESPTNPLLKIFNIREICEIAKRNNIIVAVDNTFMTPFFQQPLLLGADLVVHSATKYLNGHSDVVMGLVVLNNDDLFQKLKFLQNGLGGVPSPFDCYLVSRSLKTLHVRMERHQENAIKIASFLQNSEKVEKVFYPGLPSHPQYELAKIQMRGFGGMITFTLKSDLNGAKKFLENLKIFMLAESLGGVESLAEHPAIMTHASVPIEQRNTLGISDTLIRISVGIEDCEDLIHDIEKALKLL
eukprot:TRINITY_DN153_c1_g2_i1.p1 TRINITY_DN153_c1_g2~~TRINITY_DN153_c1_g2_i1.p1  ORF type:complete len:383 (-),score=82.83 TRINITY_DN153_c1_g2_i1:2-1150(-)